MNNFSQLIKLLNEHQAPPNETYSLCMNSMAETIRTLQEKHDYVEPVLPDLIQLPDLKALEARTKQTSKTVGLRESITRGCSNLMAWIRERNIGLPDVSIEPNGNLIVEVIVYCHKQTAFYNETADERYQRQLHWLTNYGFELVNSRIRAEYVFVDSRNNRNAFIKLLKEIGANRIRFEIDNRRNSDADYSISHLRFTIPIEKACQIQITPITKNGLNADDYERLINEVNKYSMELEVAQKSEHVSNYLIYSLITRHAFICKMLNCNTDISKEYWEAGQSARQHMKKVRELEAELISKADISAAASIISEKYDKIDSILENNGLYLSSFHMDMHGTAFIDVQLLTIGGQYSTALQIVNVSDREYLVDNQENVDYIAGLLLADAHSIEVQLVDGMRYINKITYKYGKFI